MYNDWRNYCLDQEEFDERILWSDLESPTCLVKSSLAYVLCRFITEIVKKDDSPFPPNSVKGMVRTIQMYLYTKGVYWKLLSREDEYFRDVYYVVDNVMKEGARLGLGQVKHATPVSIEMEEVMWENAILGESNPDQLRNTLLYMLGINLCLRGGEEHKKLRRPGFDPQIVVTSDSKGYKCLLYVEDTCTKTRQGGLTTKESHDPKRVYVYPNIDQSRCVVRYYEKYCNLLPIGGKHGELYLYSRKDVSGNASTDGVWYRDACKGINPLRGTVRKMLEMAGFTKGNFRNHSLRSTCCTRLYDARKDEQLIKEISGHKSNAVRNYKKTSDTLRRELSECLQTKRKSVEIETEVVEPNENYEIESKNVMENKVNLEDSKEKFKVVNRKVCHKNVGSDTHHICEMISKLQEGNKAKRIKLNLEISE